MIYSKNEHKKDYNFKYHKKQKNIIKWVFAQLLFGFCSLYMSNYLAEVGKITTVELDEERKAAMVSNLLVVLCGNRDAQPIVNSGNLY